MVAVIEVEVADQHLFGELAVRGGILAGDRDRRRRGRAGGFHGVHDDFLEAVRARAVMLSASTAKVMISAPIQASFCQSA